MQFTFFYILTLGWIYSVVISAPVDQKLLEAKGAEASDVANRLLNELAKETHTNQILPQPKSDVEEDDIEYLPVMNDSDSIYDDSASEAMELSDPLSIYAPELMEYSHEEPTYDEELTPLL